MPNTTGASCWITILLPIDSANTFAGGGLEQGQSFGTVMLVLEHEIFLPSHKNSPRQPLFIHMMELFVLHPKLELKMHLSWLICFTSDTLEHAQATEMME